MKRLILISIFVLLIGLMLAVPALPRDRYGLTMQFEKSFLCETDTVVVAADSTACYTNATTATISAAANGLVFRVGPSSTYTANSWFFLPANQVVTIPIITDSYIVYKASVTAAKSRISIIWRRMQ